jgi:hypothetical protein
MEHRVKDGQLLEQGINYGREGFLMLSTVLYVSFKAQCFD